VRRSGRSRRPAVSVGGIGDQRALGRHRVSGRAALGDRGRRATPARLRRRLRGVAQTPPARVPGVTQYETIAVEQSGPITRITLNRPDAANGMNDTMTRELADAARHCDAGATKVVVLTGSGRFFCAGGDLKSFASAPERGLHIKRVADDL